MIVLPVINIKQIRNNIINKVKNLLRIKTLPNKICLIVKLDKKTREQLNKHYKYKSLKEIIKTYGRIKGKKK